MFDANSPTFELNDADFTHALLDKIELPFVVLQHDAAVLLNNKAFTLLTEEIDELSVENGTLLLSDAFAYAQLIDAIQSCCDCAQHTLSRTIRLESGRQLAMLIEVNTLAHKSNSQTACIVTFKSIASMNWALIEEEYQLTQKELVLLKSLYAGHRLTELTEPLNSSYSTLRTHLQNMFRKFHVSSQSELFIKLSLFKY